MIGTSGIDMSIGMVERVEELDMDVVAVVPIRVAFGCCIPWFRR